MNIKRTDPPFKWTSFRGAGHIHTAWPLPIPHHASAPKRVACRSIREAFPGIELRLRGAGRAEGLCLLDAGDSDLHCGGIDGRERLPGHLRREPLPALTTDRASRAAPIPLFHTCRRHYPGGAGRRPPKDVRRYHASFSYQAGTWDKPRRVVAKIEWHPGELYPRVGFIVTNLGRPAERVVAFYNQRGTAEQWIKEGKNAIQWTRLSCRRFDHNAVRLQLHALAYNLGNFMRTLALPDAVEQWSLTSLREKLIKIGAKIVRHGRYVTFQMAEVVIPRDLFADILRRIDRLRPPPAPA